MLLEEDTCNFPIKSYAFKWSYSFLNECIIILSDIKIQDLKKESRTNLLFSLQTSHLIL